MSANTVLIASRSFGKATPEVFDELRAAGCTLLLNPHEQSPSEADMMALVRDAEVIVSGTEALTARVIAAAPQLRGIAKHGVGYENIDLDACRARGVPVSMCGDAPSRHPELVARLVELGIDSLSVSAEAFEATVAAVREAERRQDAVQGSPGRTG